MIMGRAIVCLAALSLFTTLARAAEPPKAGAKPAAAKSDFLLGEIRTVTLPPMTFIYGASPTSFEKIMEPIAKWMPVLGQAINEKKAVPAGSGMFVYKNVTGPDKPFDIEIGWVVADGTQAVGELKVRKTDAFKGAGVLLQGPANKIGEAYHKLMADTAAKKLQTTGEARELYLYWEGADSPNNVVWVLVGVK